LEDKYKGLGYRGMLMEIENRTLITETDSDHQLKKIAKRNVDLPKEELYDPSTQITDWEVTK
tara:strand:- start:12548 stop:12733 length:186 start_codon:yes stop_codon:yes gene_type:complete